MVGIYFHQYIPDSGLEHLKNYRYSCTDKSILTNYVLQPFWRKLIDFFPSLLAYLLIPPFTIVMILNTSPNMITLIGFFGILFSYAATAYYSPSLAEDMPSWVYLFNALMLFFYQTWDALDGKQARRTETSSPLGELFDHGCDAMTAVFVALTTIAAYQLGDSWLGFFTVFVAMFTFFMSQWEVYFTGSLYLGEINVTEAQVAMMIIQLACFFFGPRFWTQEIGVGDYVYPLSYWMTATTFLIAFVNNIVFIKNVIAVTAGDKQAQAISYALPAISSGVFILAWAYLSPWIALKELHFFGNALGFLFCNLVGRIVTMRVCQSRFETFYYFLLPLPTLVLNAVFDGALFHPMSALVIYCIVVIIFYLHFGLSVIHEMTSFLGIKALTIPYPNKATKNDPWARFF